MITACAICFCCSKPLVPAPRNLPSGSAVSDQQIARYNETARPRTAADGRGPESIQALTFPRKLAMGKAFTQGCCVCITLPLLRFVRICRLRSAGRAVYRDGPTKNCSVDGRGSESMCTFSRIHCRMPFTTLPDVMPFTNPPGRRVNLQLLTLLATCCLGHPLLRFALPGRLPIASIGVPIAAADRDLAVVTFAPLSSGRPARRLGATIGARRWWRVAERS